MKRPVVMVGAALAVVLALLVVRRVLNEQERQEQRAIEEREALRPRVELNTLPPEPAPEPPKAPQPRFRKKPVIVELSLKQRRGNGVTPFRGRYRVLDASGGVISEEQSSAEPATLILTPGRYELFVPSSGFRHPLTVVGDQEKTAVRVVISK